MSRMAVCEQAFTHVVISISCLRIANVFLYLCVRAFVHLRMLFVLYNILIGCVADLSEFKCLMRSCAAAIEAAAAVAKRQTWIYTITFTSWGVELLYEGIRNFEKRIPVATRRTNKPNKWKEENIYKPSWFSSSRTQNSQRSEFKYAIIKKRWHHISSGSSTAISDFTSLHIPNQFELSCFLVASFLFITFDVITLPATASNRRTHQLLSQNYFCQSTTIFSSSTTEHLSNFFVKIVNQIYFFNSFLFL